MSLHDRLRKEPVTPFFHLFVANGHQTAQGVAHDQ
jgi:hypothetical protein